MSVKEQFEEVAKKLAENPDAATSLPNEKKLEIYALFKQGSIGDVNTDRPGMLDLKGKAKWDAWNAKKGTPQEEAQQAYIDLVSALL
jgi:diazepam-binding inhibitor (GABA receptor modulating acyl-CoA-binding protein)